MAEKRKIQKTGGSTFIVSLPKKWAQSRLEPGDSVYVEEEDSSLKISLTPEKESKRAITLRYEEPIQSLLRKIIARYLVGYDRIKVTSPDVIKRKEDIERFVREKMMGMEVTGETSKRMELQNLLNYSDLPTHRVLRRMDSIIKEMYKDVLDSFRDGKKEVLEDIAKRENEVDRLYLLGVRQIKGGVRDNRLMKKLEIESRLLCLGYRMVFKSLERIGDHLKKIALILLEADEISEREKITEIGKESLSSYEKSIKSLFKLDGDLAEEAIQASKETDGDSEKLKKRLFSNGGSLQVKTIIDSMDRTRKISRDIAEIVINLSAELS